MQDWLVYALTCSTGPVCAGEVVDLRTSNKFPYSNGYYQFFTAEVRYKDWNNELGPVMDVKGYFKAYVPYHDTVYIGCCVDRINWETHFPEDQTNASLVITMGRRAKTSDLKYIQQFKAIVELEPDILEYDNIADQMWECDLLTEDEGIALAAWLRSDGSELVRAVKEFDYFRLI